MQVTHVAAALLLLFAVACGPAGSGRTSGPITPGQKADGTTGFSGGGGGSADAVDGNGTTTDGTGTDTGTDATGTDGLDGVKVECTEDGLQQECYDADSQLIGIGECKSGIRTCNGEFWSPCIGQILPVPEYCDERDNDCDGEADEGVKSACGDCNPYCTEVKSGAGTEDPLTPAEENSLNVVKTQEGWITLTSTSVNLNVIWIANSQEGTVSKLDTTTGFEEGRYRVCGDPSRTAVGAFGDGWVACRSNQATVARIVNFEGECFDNNGNGVIDTSRDLNGNHTIEPDEMMPQGEDECVKWISPVGATYGEGIARGLGVHTDGFGWVGFWNTKKIVKVEPEKGAVVQEIGISANPYGLVIDKEGIIWVSGRGGKKLVRVDPLTGATNDLNPPGSFDPYGITLDEFGRVWIAHCCGGAIVWMYDPKANTWQSVGVHTRPRGLVANMNGRMFVANDQSNEVAVIDMNTMSTFNYISLGGGRFPIGMAVDSAGFVWAVNQQSSSVHKINSFNLQIQGEFPVGKGPYTYSDMTGSAFFDAVPPGWYRHRFEAAHVGGLTGLQAMSNADWGQLVVDYAAPPGAYIKFRVRTGDTEEEVNSSLWTPLAGPFPDQTFPVDLDTVISSAGHLLDVEVWMYPSPDGHMPILKGFNLMYEATP